MKVKILLEIVTDPPSSHEPKEGRGREFPPPLPEKATPGASGYDIRSRVSVRLEPGSFEKIPTGLKVSIPRGYEAQIRPRSGLAAKHGVTVLNAPGTIDSDYRGEICAILINFGREAFQIEPGMRIAQMVIAPTLDAEFEAVPALDGSHRGENGFGSTGR